MTVIVDTTADTSNYDTMPICTGPYAVSEYVSEEKIELVANENYWDGAPEIKSITVKNIGSDTKVDAMLSEILTLHRDRMQQLLIVWKIMTISTL